MFHDLPKGIGKKGAMKLTPSELARLSALVNDALDRPPAQRAAWLARVAADEPPVAEALKVMFSPDGMPTNFALDLPKKAIATALITDANTQHRPIAEVHPGERLGPWRIVHLLGEGGMGQVWLATRDDGRYDALAALKLIRGFASSGLQRRFEAEGRLLARLTHPNIARLLDAGERADGNAYLVLEYVEGIPVDRWADEKRLGVADRLKLFLQICAAVSYAHANLVVHRDIKPANILVQENGQIKLLDFGVAKLIESDSINDFASESAVALTPEYASPEQVEGQPISVASDVYSLGVLLFFLLSGVRPFDVRSPTDQCEVTAKTDRTPLRLSTACITRAQSNTVEATSVVTKPSQATVNPEEIAALRSTTPQQLIRALRGDLDAILATALKKSPSERYGTVQALADDIHRSLSFEPVAARPAAAVYLVSRFVRRHRFGIAVTASATLSLIAFSAIIARESAMHRRTTEFLLHSLTPTSYYTDGGGVLSQTELLKRAADGVATKFADNNAAASELYETIGESLFNLGAHEDAYQVRTRAQPTIDAAFGRTSKQAVRNAGRATYMHLTQRRFPEFLASMDDLRARCPSLDSLPEPHCYTYIWMQTQHYAYTGEGHKRHAMWKQYDARITPHVDAKSRWHSIVNYWGAGGARQAGDLRAAKARWQKFLALPETQNGALGDHMTSLSVALLLTDAGFYTEAAALSRTVYAQGERWMGAAFDPYLFYVPGVASAEAAALTINAASGDGNTETQLRAAIARAVARGGVAAEQETADVREALALWLIARGRYAEAVEPLEQAIALHSARGGTYNQYVAHMRMQRAVLRVLLAPDNEKVTARNDASAALNALRTVAVAIPDHSSLPRIDALLAALEPDSAASDAHWTRAVAAMQSSDLRPGDIAVLLRALGSSRTMPSPVDDEVVRNMRAYAARVLATTESALAKRKAPDS